MAPGSLTFLVALGVAWACYWVGPRQWRREAIVVVSYGALAIAAFETAVAVALLGLIGWTTCVGMTRLEDRRQLVARIGLAGILGVLVGGSVLIDAPTQVRTLATSGLLIASMHAASLVLDHQRRVVAKVPTVAQALLFVGFFATVGVGPLTREDRLDRAIRRAPERPSGAAHSEALELAIVGGFKLLVVASALAPAVGDGYLASIVGDANSMSILALLMWSVVVRIFGYMALSGSIDLARAGALTMSIRLPRETRRPLTASVDVTDYWRRHHATFMGWARDYIFRAVRSTQRSRGWLPLAATFMALSLLHGLSISWIVNAILMATVVWWEGRRPRRSPRSRWRSLVALLRVWLLLTLVSFLAFGGVTAWRIVTAADKWWSLAAAGRIAPSLAAATFGLVMADWHAFEMERDHRSLARDVIVAVSAVAMLLWVGVSVVPPFAYGQ